MHKGIIKTGAVCALLAVIAGAFGSHALRDLVKPETLNIYETGVRYQMYHALALIITGILHKDFSEKSLKRAARFFLVGTILFSGSLYVLTYAKAFNYEILYKVGIVTPVGGLYLITGWIFIFISVLKNPGAEKHYS